MNLFFTQLISSFKRNTATSRFFVFSAVLAFLLVGVGKVSRGQVNITAGNTVTQNFDGIGLGPTSTLPSGWKIENVTGARNVSTAYDSVANTTTTLALAFNAALSSSAGNGRYNFGGSSSTDRAVGGLSSGSASQSVNMYLQLTNNGAGSISSFTISYDAERYRNGSNTAGFSIRFYYSTTGNAGSWVEVPAMAATFTANADNNGSTTNPLQTISISNQTLSQSLAASGSIYCAWSYSVTSGTTTSNAQALGIDNISISANGAGGSSPTLTTPTATSVNTTSAILGATITGDGGASITSRGTVYGTTSSPTGNSLNEGGTATGAFTHSRTGLTANTFYYYRGFAVNTNGTGYSPDGTFTTLHNAPNVGSGTGATASSFTAQWTAPTGGGSATFTYEIQVNDDNTFTNANEFSQTGISSGTISVNVNTGLTAGTTYYYRVRANNAGGSSAWSSTSAGIATLNLSAPTVTSPTATAITTVSATLGGNVTSDGGASVTARGVVWSVTATNNNPAIGGSGVTNVTGTGTTGVFTVSATGLPTGTQISYRAYATNSQGTTYTTATTITTLAAEPTAAPSNLVFSSVTTIGFNVSFTAATGSPAGYLVLRRSGSAPTGTPADGTAYTVGQTNIGGGTNTVAYVGPLPSPDFLENTLTAETRYYYEVFSFNGSGSSTNYYTTAELSGNRWTLATEPTSQGSPSVTNIQPTSMQLTGFNSGGGDNVIIIAKQGSAVDAFPIDGVNYTASATFGSGASLGGGNFVVGINPADPLTVSGLTPGLTYHFAAFDYNGTLSNLNANFLTSSPGTANGTTPSNSSDIVVVGGSESATISSLTNIATISTSSDGTPVWQFTIRDGGGTSDADNLPTIVNTLVFTQNTGNQMDNFLNAIQSIALFNGSTLISNTPTITATQISFSGLGLVVPDGGSLTVTVRMSVKSNVNAGSSTGVNADGDDFVFQLTAGNQVTGSTTTSSQFVSTFSPVVASANGSNVYSVVATRLSFVQQPTEVNLNAAMSPAVTVSAEDVGGNRDINYATDIVVTSTGALSGSSVTASPTAGLATYNTLTHTSLGTSLQLTASSGSFTPVTSDPFNVTSGPTTLAAGDVAVLAMGVNTPDKIAIILLKGINAGTVIHITDNGMASATTGRTGEGFLTYTAPTAQCAGTILTWQSGQNVTGTGWNSGAPTNFALNNSGDQIFVFQGSTSNWATQTGVTLLYAFQTANTWITTGTATASNSYEPSALASQFKIQFTGLSETDVYYTNASVSGTASAILTSLANTANYTKQNTAFTMPSYTSALEVSNFSSSVFSTSCIGSGARVTVNSTVLETGSYTVTYSLSGTNTGSNLTSSMSFTAGAPGTGTFTTASLSNAGATTITIHSVSLNGCALVTGSGNVVNTTVGNTNTWVGTTGNWTDAANWSCGVPTATQSISIPSGTVTLNTNYTVADGYSFTLSGTGSFIIDPTRSFTIGGTVDFGGRPVTLRSSNAGTATIPQITGTLTGASNVTAERHIPARRAWRGLAVPLRTTSGSAFVWDHWQNGGTQTTGEGALIWKPGGTFSAGDGYSAGGVNSNLLAYSAGAFTAPASTKTAVLFNTNGPVPYVLFATDYFRSATGTGNITSGSAATTLRATGTLYTGAYNTGTLSAGFHLIPNPYPSPITLSSGLLTSVANKFWVWDPRLAGNNGYGGYVYTSSGLSVPTGGSYSSSSIVIPQGSAFWVESTGSGSISMTEATKGGTSFNIFGRTTGNPGVLRLNLANTAGDQLYDGVAVAFESNTSAGLDAQDAVKFSLGTDNLSIRRSGKDLAIEFRPPATSADTIFLQLHNLKQAAYRFEFSSETLSGATGATALLKDRYLGTETPLQLGSGQQIGFQVDGNAASAGNRFYIVFRAGTVTPVVDLNGARGFAVYPNPVPAGSPLQVEFRNRVAGTYQFVLYSSTGVQVAQRVVQHGGGTAVQSVQLPQQLPAGMYIAEFTDAKGGKQQLKINIQ